MLFGRAFERALGALFRREDPGAVLFAEWAACQGQGLHYSNGDSWDRMLRQGIALLTRFCQDDRVRVWQPQRRLVEGTIRRIESADFLPHSGIRFPQNPCSSCPYVGLCLGKQEIADPALVLVQRPGADSLDWLDELSY